MADASQSRWSARARHAIELVLDCACVGVLIGAIDVVVVARHSSIRAGELPLLAFVAIGLVIALCTTVGLPILLLGRALRRHPWIRVIADGLKQPGAQRVEAIVRIAIAVIAAAAMWGVGYAVVKRVIGMFKHAGGAALLASTLILAGSVAIVVGAAAISAPAGRFAGRSALLGKVTRGWPGRGLLVATLIVVLVALRVVTTIAPAFDPSLAYEITATLVALLVASATNPSRRFRRGWQLSIAGALAAVLAIGSLITVGSSDRVRGAISGQGLVSREVLVGLWTLTDGDGDRYSDRFGGADCDDSDPAVHPAAQEIPGNGRDDNCILGDAPRRPRSRAPVVAPPLRYDILLITIDTVRADHVSSYGYERATTPAFDALASRASRFAAAHTTNPWTRFALPALALGRYPSTLPFRSDGVEPVLAEHGLPTLATVLRGAGYATVSSLPPTWQDLGTALVGFDDTLGVLESRDVADAAIAWLHKRSPDKPYFMWLHLADPHYPYAPAETTFGTGEIDRYDAEIAAADAQIGRVLADLAASGRADRTIVVVTSDHGESFGERGVRFHNRNLYEEQTRVPLVIAVPTGKPRVVAEPVSLVDLAPTLLDFVGVATPPGMSGVSLAAVARDGAPVPSHPVLTELAATGNSHRNLVGLHDGNRVIIRDNVAWTHEVYDLATDPNEHDNLSEDAMADDLRNRLDEAVEHSLATE